MVKLIWFFAATIFTLNIGFGQNSVCLEGHVTDQGGDFLAGALVTLYKTDSVTLVQYTRSDSLGNWSFHKIKAQEYYLKIAFLGCFPWTRRLSLNNSDTLTVNAALFCESKQLKTVEISAEKIGIITRGDTIIYNLSTFLDSTEHDLKDILVKLPFISVAENGEIRFKGKRIDYALAEGEDIFGQMHKQMTESIRAEEIKGVQVIQNYKEDSSQLIDGGREKVAINVQLTNNSKNKLNGNAEVKTNLVNLYEVGATGYKVGSKISLTSFLRGNNTTQAILSPSDLFALLDLDDLQNARSPEIFEKYLPLLNPILDIQGNNDWLCFSKMNINHSKYFKTKASVFYNNFNRFSEKNSFRIYTKDLNLFNGLKRQEQPTQLVQIDIKNVFNKGKFRAAINLPFTNSLINTNREVSGLFDSTSIQNIFFESRKSLKFSPDFTFNYKINNRKSIVFSIKSDHVKEDKSTTLNAQFPLFDLPDSAIAQNLLYNSNHLEASASFVLKVAKSEVRLTPGIGGVNFESDLYTKPLPNIFWNNHAIFKDREYFIELYFGKTTSNFRYHLEAAPKIINRKSNNAYLNTSYKTISTSTGLFYDFSKIHNIYFTTVFNSEPINFSNLIQTRQIIDESTLRIESPIVHKVFSTASLNLNYSNGSVSGNWFYNLKLNYVQAKNTIAYYANVEDGLLIYRSVLMPKSKKTAFEVAGSYNLKKWDLKIVPQVTLESSEEYLPANIDFNNSKREAINNNLVFFYYYNKRFVFDLNTSANFTTTKFLSSGLASQFLRTNLGLGCKFNTKSFLCYSNLKFQQQSFAKKTAQFWVLNVDVEYVFPNAPIKIKFTGRNLLNFKGNILSVPDFNINYIGIDTFQTVGSQLLIGASYIF